MSSSRVSRPVGFLMTCLALASPLRAGDPNEGQPPAYPYPQPGYQDPAYPQPAYQDPNYPQPAYLQPGFSPPPGPGAPGSAYPEPAYPQPAYPQAPGLVAPGSSYPGAPGLVAPGSSFPQPSDPEPAAGFHDPMGGLVAPGAMGPGPGASPAPAPRAPVLPERYQTPSLPDDPDDGQPRVMGSYKMADLVGSPRMAEPGFQSRVLGEINQSLPGWVLSNSSAHVDFAMQLGGNPNLESGGSPSRPILAVAAAKGFDGICRHLLRAGADPNRRDKTTGRNALHWAAAAGEDEPLLDLLEYRGDFKALDKAGATPRDLAKAKGHSKVVELLDHVDQMLATGKVPKYKTAKPR